MNDPLDDEIDANFDAFQRILPDLLKFHEGKFVVLRHREVDGVFDSLTDALRDAARRFSDRMFSVQEVTARTVDLGFFSHAVDIRIA